MKSFYPKLKLRDYLESFVLLLSVVCGLPLIILGIGSLVSWILTAASAFFMLTAVIRLAMRFFVDDKYQKLQKIEQKHNKTGELTVPNSINTPKPPTRDFSATPSLGKDVVLTPLPPTNEEIHKGSKHPVTSDDLTDTHPSMIQAVSIDALVPEVLGTLGTSSIIISKPPTSTKPYPSLDKHPISKFLIPNDQGIQEASSHPDTSNGPKAKGGQAAPAINTLDANMTSPAPQDNLVSEALGTLGTGSTDISKPQISKRGSKRKKTFKQSGGRLSKKIKKTTTLTSPPCSEENVLLTEPMGKNKELAPNLYHLVRIDGSNPPEAVVINALNVETMSPLPKKLSDQEILGTSSIDSIDISEASTNGEEFQQTKIAESTSNEFKKPQANEKSKQCREDIAKKLKVELDYSSSLTSIENFILPHLRDRKEIQNSSYNQWYDNYVQWNDSRNK